MLKALLPQPATSAGIAETFDGKVTKHRHSPQLVGAGARRVRMELAICNRHESSLPGHLQCAAVITSTGTGKVFDGAAEDFFNLELCIPNFTLWFRFRQVE